MGDAGKYWRSRHIRVAALHRPHRTLRLTALVAGILSLAALPRALSQQTEPPRSGVAYLSLQVENDFFGSGADRHYTHGMKLSGIHRHMPRQWLDAVAGWLPFFRQGNRRGVEFSLGQSIFTPDDIENTALIPSDRPFAGWTYASANLLAMRDQSNQADTEDRKNRRTADSLEITLGLIGPSSGADFVQREFHDLIDAANPRGWDHQLHDEPGLMLKYVRVEERFRTLGNGLETSIAPHFVVAAGNVYTYAGAGLTTRFGTGLRTDVGPPTISPGFPGTAYFDNSTWGSVSLFAGVELRAVARNVFLDGNTFRNSHSVAKKPLVLDAQVGLAFRVFENIRVAVTNVFRSREFEGQQEYTEYGAVNVTVLF